MRLIDADALTKRFVEFCNKNCPYTAKARNVMCGSCFMGLALEAVEDAPTIEEGKTGKWIDGYKRQTCSVCKQRGYRSWSFCPNCGADMRGENDD